MAIQIIIRRKEFSTGKEFAVCVEVSDKEFEMSDGKVLDWQFEQVKKQLFNHLKERSND